MILSILAVIFTFGIVIFIHEFGHFIVCKLVGVFVEEFSFGFGKPLFSKNINGTLYAVRAVPLGGYVKPKGEDINEHKGDSDEYFSKKWYQRIFIVLAGPFMNYFLSFIIFFGVIYFVGKPVPSQTTLIGDVATNYPAYNAGLREGDRIISINSKKVSSWKEMTEQIYPNIEKEISIDYERDSKIYSVKLKTAKDSAMGRGIIGIAPKTDYEKIGILKSANYSLYQLWYWTNMTITTLASNIIKMEKPDVAGPIGIITIVSKAAHSDLADFLFLVGLISIAVGFFNLLPLPLLDGGHFVMYLFEGILRKKITPKVMRYVQSTGIAILVSILIFATYNDVMRIYNAKKEKANAEQKLQK
ncbi:MAG: RIP metalloprotease RseP [Elusimicrobiales bacterium]|nr:RIP metalloprotease RseP [Elusimicrobiales bacterium]HOL63532.1 RIP metalloprotease RseP [Elusimicrobiales bacterium]HPO94813.1 RIP metalloprotease RseP [Elusimicrobiales bacterium]